MSQTPNSPNDPMATAPASTAPAAGGVAMDPKEVADGKVLAILGYIPALWLIAIIMLFVRNNAFVVYHAKQVLLIVILWLAGWIPILILGAILAAITKGIGACVIPVLMLLLGLTLLVGVIMGIINAANGVCKPLPVIGVYAEKWFAGIQKKAA